MKNLLWMIPVGFFVLLLILRMAITPYDMYKNQEHKIDKLQNGLNASQSALEEIQKKVSQLQYELLLATTSKSITKDGIFADTKQDIRTFLESMNREIIQRIDTRQTEIHVLISIPKQIELKDLSKRPDFDKFLSCTPTGDICIACDHLKDFIMDLSQAGEKDGYYLHPKDALIK